MIDNVKASPFNKLYGSVSFQDRAVKIGKQKQYWLIKAPPGAGAPYDRLCDLLHTKVWASVYPQMLFISSVTTLNSIVAHTVPVQESIKVQLKLNISSQYIMIH